MIELAKILRVPWPCSEKRRKETRKSNPFMFGFSSDWLKRFTCDLIGCKIMHAFLEQLWNLAIKWRCACVIHLSTSLNRPVQTTCFPAVFDESLLSRLFYYQVKQEENEAALLLLSKRLKELDALPWERRQLALIEGIIAGNVFDWGAKEVAK